MVFNNEMNCIVRDFSIFLIICTIYSYINGITMSIEDEIIRKFLWITSFAVIYIHLGTYAVVVLFAAIIIHLNDEN